MQIISAKMTGRMNSKSMIIDGKSIAEEIKSALKEEIEHSECDLSLGVFVLTDDFATRKFIAIKQKVAEEINVRIELYDLPVSTSTEELVEKVRHASKKHEGIIVQFPLPAHIDRDKVRNAIEVSRDVDVISDPAAEIFAKGGVILPPVVGAMQTILEKEGITLNNKNVVIVGSGQLVGKPAGVWARGKGADVKTVNVKSHDITEIIHSADVLVLGAGAPGLVTSEMVKEGVVILDAGTSEAKGKLKGDADPECALKASLFTPVPGGIGPITVVMIFKNLLGLHLSRVE